ncbi:Major Facilitator Superfamily (MFS) [Phytophthora palmivora]|uniref:Major Facilitator Superfamily (MFS) n=1 Tax=Phytophthora palmivora TaxID=4796 RepID=A0A2P4X563_9STRA|nr:Major Facilitator Superfamily (MFS) [Phytophthora palmivora]
MAGLLLMGSVGSNHSISVWNAQLRALLGFSEAGISFVCSMASFGAYFSVTPGFVFDRIGAHNSVLLGGFLLASIYLGLYVGLVTFPETMTPLGVGIAFVVLGQATNFGVFAALGPNEDLFGHEHRGKVMAIELAAFSAGGALFAELYKHLFDGEVAQYFRFMGCLMLTVFVLAWVTLYRPTKDDTTHSVSAAPPMHALEEFMPPDAAIVKSSFDVDESCYLVSTVQYDVTGRDILSDSRFWLLFATVFILVGSSLFVMANIAFIVESLGGPMEQIPTMVALFSVGNCCGRVVAGIISDSVLDRFPRIYFISLASILVGSIHTLFLIIPRAYLIIPITLAGIADGVMFAAFPVLTRETFGARHFGKNFGLISVANALGFPLFFSPVGSFVYSWSAQPVDGIQKCLGDDLLAGVLLMLGVGSTYALSAWNAQLKTLLHFTQAGISMVSAMTMLGSYMSYIPGMIFDRLGPYTSVLLSGTCMLAVHLAMFTALQFAPESVSPLGIGCAMMLFGLLSSFCVFSSIVPNESLFGDANRGKVMASLTSAYSCGGAFFAFVFHEGFNGSDVPGYFLFVGNYLIAACVFGWCVFARPVREEESKDKKRRSGSVEFGLGGISMESSEQVNDAADSEKPDDITGVALLTDVRFWMLFIPVMIVIGAGLLVMSNVSFIVESLGGPVDQVPLMVAVFSILNTLGRLLTGAVSDLLLTRYPRAYFTGASALFTAITQGVFLSVSPRWLVLPVAMAGFSEGVMFGTFPVIIREEFGLQHFGKNFGLLSLANCVGYPLFFSPLASYVYQHSTATRTVDGVEKCFGTQCFGPVFIVAIALSAVALVCSIQLARLQRRRKFYSYQQIRP